MKRKVALLKKIIVALGLVFVGAAAGHAQNTPTLSLAAGKVGITSGQAGIASNYEFYMELPGYPRAVTAGETVFMMGSWPNGNNPTMSDDKSNPWAAVASCNDSTNKRHGFFYAVNASANTSVITETHGSPENNEVFDWAHFYNMSTSPSGFVDGSSCTTGVTPVNNTPPNISGTPYTTTTSMDLILVCVYVEQSMLGFPNAISSITWPSGFTGLNDDIWTYGHACAYGVQTTAGSFTPTFTVAQGTHNTFTIMSAAFKAGSGGTAPGNGASIVLSQMFYIGSQGQTAKVYLPCPVNVSAIVVSDDVGSLNTVTDSGSNTWARVGVPGNFYGPIFYTNNPIIGSSNSFTVTMTFTASGSYDLVGLYCVVGTGGIDTAATAQNGATLNGAGSGSTYNSTTISGNTIANIPSTGTSMAGDLIFAAGSIGFGPATSCITNHCVFDYVGSTSWTNGDNESYANGDIMAHAYAATPSAVSFSYNVVNTGSSAAAMSLAFKPASGGGGPAPPTGLKATVQ
jgi:hypothetical protein